jgi:hypothetical protein
MEGIIVGFFGVLLVAGLVALFVSMGWPLSPPGGVVAVLLLLATVARAEDAAPIPATPCTEIPGFIPCSLVVSGYAGTATLFRPGQNKYAIAFSRLQGDLLTGIGRLHLAARIDTSAQPDGADITVSGSFQSIEVRAMAHYPVSPVLSLAVVGGGSAPLLPTTGVARRYPALYGGGILLGSPRARTWVFAGSGVDQAAGNGVKALFAVQVRIKGSTYFIVDGAWGGAGSYARPGSALGTGN